ncbi:MAG: CDP-alcohol phosphatidyltransferase family protein [Candidatus Omnitrophota bacterium]|nr:CDP-alcohol phosphatidyltransferase family protein [Candidatus Omnitrophota bacterium]
MNLANRISILRILLTPFFIGCVLYYKPEHDYLRFVALGIFGLAVLSDALDGFLARVLKQKTMLGTILDPIADKLLLITAFISLANWPADIKLPLWMPIIVVSRDLFIVLGVVVIFLMSGDVKISPSPLGKITTFFQMATIISVLLLYKHSEYVWNLAVIFTLLSGINYLIRGARLLNGNHVKK